jgi:hypothetical protein
MNIPKFNLEFDEIKNPAFGRVYIDDKILFKRTYIAYPEF